MEYKIIKTKNGFILEQWHTLHNDEDKNLFGTKWVFNDFSSVIEFLAKKFGA